MTLLDPVYGDDDYTKSYDVTKALLDANPDLKGLIVPTTVGGPAVSKCIKDEGLTGKVKVTGLTLATDMAEYIHEGIADATFLWNPIELGYVSSYVGVAMVNGEFEAAEGATIEVPGFEGLQVTVSDDGGLTSSTTRLLTTGSAFCNTLKKHKAGRGFPRPVFHYDIGSSAATNLNLIFLPDCGTILIESPGRGFHRRTAVCSQ